LEIWNNKNKFDSFFWNFFFSATKPAVTESAKGHTGINVTPENIKGGTITVPLTSSLTGLELAV
jgi:hypothetical protein